MAEVEATEIPDDRRYSAEHEWALLLGDVVVVGITDYAQHELGDVVYVELPKVGEEVIATRDLGAIESVKAASDIFSPVTGEIVAVNEDLVAHPEWVNESPYERGWMVRIRLDDPAELDELLDAEAYRQLLSG